MIWSIDKLETERVELIEVIEGLRSWQRSGIDDWDVISLHITGHMMRLSALEEEISNARHRSKVENLQNESAQLKSGRLRGFFER